MIYIILLNIDLHMAYLCAYGIFVCICQAPIAANAWNDHRGVPVTQVPLSPHSLLLPGDEETSLAASGRYFDDSVPAVAPPPNSLPDGLSTGPSAVPRETRSTSSLALERHLA